MNTDTSPPPATLSHVDWLTGAWSGGLGPQRVEEAWSEPAGGTMSTMVRLMGPEATLMVELIVIREQAGSLMLHLRQFTPDLQLVTEQDMPLAELEDRRVAFRNPEGGTIPKLEYQATGESTMKVHVTTADGTVVTAELERC